MTTRRKFLGIASSAALCAYVPMAGAWQGSPVTRRESLRAHAEARGLLIGCAVVPQRLTGEIQYGDAVAAQANLLVAENVMKWKALRPAIDKFDFRGADAILAFAAAHGQKVRGHNLCWHEALPDWFASSVTKENARNVLEQHIQTVAGRYAGKLHSWDVVNEAVDPKSGRPDGLRKSPWVDLIGPEYIDIAFRAARKADPKALLTYNDYNIENDTADQREKREQVLKLVQGMKARNVPIDAVGVQSHLVAADPMPGGELREFVRELRRMGLQVFVTEMDVNDHRLAGSVAERDAGVAKVYRDYVSMMLAEPNVTAVLTWGITDKYTWLDGAKYVRSDGQPQRCLPFDADYQPTPAFFALRDAIDSRVSA